MIESELWKEDKWLCADSSTTTGRTESPRWTSSENVRLVAAFIKCNPDNPNWENISELMKNQPDAKQRSPDFFSPRNCATQFQQVNQKYFSHNYGVYDTARGCEASFLADHLIRVLATEALLEKSQLLGKNLAAAQSRSVTPQNPSFSSDWSFGSSASSALDIIPDTIFEDAVQYESPAESLSQDYFHMDTSKNQNLVLTGPTVIARKSTPKKLDDEIDPDETRHFSGLQTHPSASGGNNRSRKTQPVRKSPRGTTFCNSEVVTSMTQRPSYPSPPPGPQQRRPPSVSAPIRKKKFAGISEISEKLALNAAAVASSANTNDKSATAHSHNKGMPGPQGVNDMKTTNSRMSNRMRRKEENKEKVALSFQINGGQKIISLSQLKKHDQRIRRLQPISQKQKPRTKAAVKHIPRTAPLPSPANLAFSSTPPRTSHKFLKGNKSSTKASVFKTPLQRQRNCKFAPVVPSLVKFHNPPSSSNNADKEVHEVLTESLELVSLQEPEILRLSCSINIADQQIHIPTVSKMTKVENEIDTQADGMSPEEAPVHDDEKHLPEVQSNNNEILISDTATPIINTVTPDQPQANCANEAETNETRNLETLDDTLLTSDAHTICNELFLHGSNPKQNYKKSACAEDEHTKDTSRRVLRSNKNVFDHQQNSKGFEEKDAPQVPTRDSQLFLPPPACTCQPHGSQKVAISKKCPVHSYKLVHACKEEPEIILEAEASTTPVASSSSRVHDADKNEAKVPQEELEFLFRQVLGFCPKEFYANADTGFQDGNNTAIKMPMDLVTVFKMLQEDKIETMADLQRNLMLAFTNGIFVMNSNEHPIVKKAHSAILSLRKLFLEYATNQILHERYSQFQETGLVVLPLSEIEEQMNPKAGNRPLSPDITDLPLRRRKGKNK